MSAGSGLAELPRGRGRVHLRREGALCEVVLDNPGARNAMSIGMMVDFIAIVESLSDDPPLALLIYGAGTEGFCAGGDLQDVRAHLMNAASGREMCAGMGRAMDLLGGLSTVIVCAVEGAALGGGAELTQLARWVVIGDTAKIGFVHARLGVSPGWGGGRLLLARVGVRGATEVLLHARAYAGEDALRVGLADQVATDGDVVNAARGWIAEVMKHPEASIRGALSLLNEARSSASTSLSQTEAQIFEALWAGPAHRTALSKLKAGG